MSIEFKILATGSKSNAYLLKNEEDTLLLEAGIPWKQLQKKMNFKTHTITACLATHRHIDHSKFIRGPIKAGIDTYISQDIIDHYALSGHRVHRIMPLEQIQLGSFAARALLIPHDEDCPNMAFLLASGREKFLFAIDCLYFPYLIPGLTGIAIGINYQTEILKENVRNGTLHPSLARRIMASHCSLQTALEFFGAQDLSRVREINILHTSKTNADKEQIQEAIQRQTGKLVII